MTLYDSVSQSVVYVTWEVAKSCNLESLVTFIVVYNNIVGSNDCVNRVIVITAAKYDNRLGCLDSLSNVNTICILYNQRTTTA